jgi:hypothetical protein
MNPNEKTRLLIGSLTALVVVVIGFGLYQAFGTDETPVPPSSAVAPQGGTISQEAPEPGQPILQISTESAVPENSSGHEASVTGDSGLVYEWTISGGNIEGDPHGTSINWTAGNGKEVVLTCKGTAEGKEGSTSFRVLIRQAPGIARFEAVPMVLTEGTSAKLSWTVSNAQKLTLDPGGQDVTKYNGPPLEVKPTETTTYALTASNGAGLDNRRELILKVVPKPEIITLKSNPVAGSRASFTVTAEFKGSKAELKNGDTVITTSEASPLSVQVNDLKEGSALVLTVSNEAGTYVTNSLTFSTKKP